MTPHRLARPTENDAAGHPTAGRPVRRGGGFRPDRGVQAAATALWLPAAGEIKASRGAMPRGTGRGSRAKQRRTRESLWRAGRRAGGGGQRARNSVGGGWRGGDGGGHAGFQGARDSLCRDGAGTGPARCVGHAQGPLGLLGGHSTARGPLPPGQADRWHEALVFLGLTRVPSLRCRRSGPGVPRGKALPGGVPTAAAGGRPLAKLLEHVYPCDPKPILYGFLAQARSQSRFV